MKKILRINKKHTLKNNKPVHCINCVHYYYAGKVFLNEEDNHFCFAKAYIESKLGSPIEQEKNIRQHDMCHKKNKNNDCPDFSDKMNRVVVDRRYELLKVANDLLYTDEK